MALTGLEGMRGVRLGEGWPCKGLGRLVGCMESIHIGIHVRFTVYDVDSPEGRLLNRCIS